MKLSLIEYCRSRKTVWAGLIALGCVLLFHQDSTHALVSYEGSTCADIVVVFARGSGQNSNNPYDYPEDGPRFESSSIKKDEGETYTFFKSIYKKINRQQVSTQYLSLHDFGGKYNGYGYDAVDAKAIREKPLHRKDVNDRYYESVKDGAEELTWYLEDQMTSCPLQRFVLGGYSQGAQVVGDAVAKLQPQFRSRIVYMALYGDPKFNPNNGLYPVISGTWKRGNTTNVTQGILGTRKPYIPDGVQNAGSWCNKGDTICDAGYAKTEVPGNYIDSKYFTDDIHSLSYQDTWIEKSAPEIAKAIKNAIPAAASNTNTSVFINKNDKLWKLDLAIVIDTAHTMGPAMQSIKGNATSLSTSLLGAYWDARVGVVTYDSGRPGHPMSYVESPFTNNGQDIRSSIMNIPLRPDLGANEYRVMRSGLMTAMNELDWRYGAQKKIITITDKPPSNDAQSRDGWTDSDVRLAAYNLDPAVLNFANVACDETWSCSDELHTAVESLAQTSDGAVFDANMSFDSIGDLTFFLEDSEMQPVAGISGDETGYKNTPINLSGDRSYDPNGTIETFRWDCDGDLVWDNETTQPNTTCEYSAAYEGLVTLQVVSDDGGTATATMPVKISGTDQPKTPTHTKPQTTIRYDNTGTTVHWKALPSTGVLRFSDHEGNILGYAPTSAYGVRFGTLGPEMPFITVAFGEGMYWSDETTIPLDGSLLEKQTQNEPPFTILYTAPGTTFSASARTNAITNRRVLAAHSSIQNEPWLFAQTQPSDTAYTPNNTTDRKEQKPDPEKQNHTYYLAGALVAFTALMYGLRKFYFHPKNIC